MNVISANIPSVIQDYIKNSSIEQGIVGIQLPGFVSTDLINSIVNELFYIRDIQIVVIPPPRTDIFDSDIEEDVKAIGGRVQRDRLDGIRYNRVYIALYWDDLGSLNNIHHDLFIKVEEKNSLTSLISISDNRNLEGTSQ